MNDFDRKLEYVINEINNIQNQIYDLKKVITDLSEKKNRVFEESHSKEETTLKQADGPIIFSHETMQAPVKQIENHHYTEEPQASTFKVYGEEEKPKRDFESLVGKSFMGVFAPALILISLVLFASAIYPYLNQTLKLIGMYGISILFLVIGLWRLQKEKNVFNISLTGCGLGAIYVSLLLTDTYFHLISDMVLYLLITVWALFVIYLSKLKSNTFYYIGETGILIAVIFGASNATLTQDFTKILPLAIFTVFGSLLYTILNHSKDLADKMILNLFNIVELATITLTIRNNELNIENSILLYAILFFSIIVHLLCIYFREEKRTGEDISYSILHIIYSILACSIINLIWKDVTMGYAISIIYAFILLVANELKFNRASLINKQVVQIFCGILIAFLCVHFNTSILLASLGIFAFLFALYGSLVSKNIFKYMSLVYLLMLFFTDVTCIVQLLIGIVTLGILTYALIVDKDHYNVIIKNMVYGLAQLCLLTAGYQFLGLFLPNIEAKRMTIFTAMSLLSAVTALPLFYKNLVKDEKEEGTILFAKVIKGCLMIAGLIFISTVEHVVSQIVAICVSLVLFLAGSKEMLEKDRDNLGYGIYVGLKLTLLLIVILNSFNMESFAISIGCLIFAIIALIVGFVAKYKSIRVYGLALTLISIIKLILFDMKYTSTLEHAISVFVCGILCFGVSMMYNYVDNKLKKS